MEKMKMKKSKYLAINFCLIVASAIFVSCYTGMSTSQKETNPQEIVKDTLPEPRFDPKAANFSHLFNKSTYLLSLWDTVANEGYGVLSSKELVYMKSWSNDDLGFHVKILINDPEHGVNEESLEYWLPKVVSYSSLFLDNEDLSILQKQISAKEYSIEKTSKLSIFLNNEKYNEHWIVCQEINMSTVVFQLVVNRDF